MVHKRSSSCDDEGRGMVEVLPGASTMLYESNRCLRSTCDVLATAGVIDLRHKRGVESLGQEQSLRGLPSGRDL